MPSGSTIKLVHTADFHLGATFRTLRGPRLEHVRREDFRRNVERVVTECLKRSVDLLLVSGDVFHYSDPSPRDFVFFARQIGRLAEAGVHVVVIAGNHDLPKVYGAQNPMQGLVEAKAPYFRYLQAVPSEPLVLDLRSTRVGIVPIPYVDPRVVKAAGDRTSYDGFLRDKIGEMRDHEVMADVDYKILMGHFTVTGALLRPIFPSMLEEPRVSRSSLGEESFDYIALGHVHTPQRIGERIYYSGSVERIDFAEEGEGKSFLYVELSPRGLEVEEVPLECRPMVTRRIKLSGSSDPYKAVLEHVAGVPRGALLRLFVEGDPLVLKMLEEKRGVLEEELFGKLGIAGYAVKREARSGRAEIPRSPSKLQLRERVLEYIESLEVGERLRRRAKELAEELMDEVGLP